MRHLTAAGSSMITVEGGAEWHRSTAASEQQHFHHHPEEGLRQHPQLHRNAPEAVGCFAVWLAVSLLSKAQLACSAATYRPITAATSHHTIRARQSQQGNVPLQNLGPVLHQLGDRVSSIVFFSLAYEANGPETSVFLTAHFSEHPSVGRRHPAHRTHARRQPCVWPI